MKNGDFVASAANQVAVGGVFAGVLTFLLMQEMTVPVAWQLAWLCFGPVLYGVDQLFLRKERTIQALGFLNAGAGVLLFAGLLLSGTWTGGFPLYVTIFGCIWLSYRAAALHRKAISLSEIIQWLDISLVLLTLFVAYLSAVEGSLLLALPLALGCCAAIVGMVSYRAGGELAPRDWCLMGGLLGGIAGLSCLCAFTIARGAGQGLVVLWKGAGTVWNGIYSVLYRFLLWLSSLMQEQEYDTLLTEEQATVSVTQAEEAMPEFTVPGVVFVVLGLLAVAVVVYLIWYSGRVRFKGSGTKIAAKKRSRRHGVSLWQAIWTAFARLAEDVRLWVYLLLHRHTALGIFYRLVRSRYGKTWRQGVALTPREFLTREAEQTHDAEKRSALLELIAPVEAALYTRDGRDLPFAKAELLCR